MRLVPISDISGDEILAQPIYDIDGRKLLSQGVRLKPTYTEKLREKGIVSIYVEDAISEGIEIDETLCLETRVRAKQIVSQELNRFVRTKEIHVQELIQMVNDIVEEVLSSRKDLINLKDVRMQDEYLFAHSVNVCALSIMLASKMGYNREKIKGIGLGALLHDFGKMLIPPSLLNKETDLSQDEIQELNKHPLYGYNIFKDDSSISSTVKIAILMHHENLDGSGFPLGLTGEKIHYSARIVSICNLFDSITCDRKFKLALSTADAVERLSCSAGVVLDKAFTDEFLNMIPIFPNGTMVLLSNGLVGIVISNNTRNRTRPVVRLVYNPKTKTRYNNNYIVDLMEDLTLKVLREIHLPASELNG